MVAAVWWSEMVIERNVLIVLLFTNASDYSNKTCIFCKIQAHIPVHVSLVGVVTWLRSRRAIRIVLVLHIAVHERRQLHYMACILLLYMCVCCKYANFVEIATCVRAQRCEKAFSQSPQYICVHQPRHGCIRKVNGNIRSHK